MREMLSQCAFASGGLSPPEAPPSAASAAASALALISACHQNQGQPQHELPPTPMGALVLTSERRVPLRGTSSNATITSPCLSRRSFAAIEPASTCASAARCKGWVGRKVEGITPA